QPVIPQQQLMEKPRRKPSGPKTQHNFRKLKWTAAVVGAATLAFGITAEVIAMSNSNDIESKACNSRPCSSIYRYNPDLQDTYSMGQTFSTLGLVSLLVGVGASATAITLFALDDSAHMEPERRRHHSLSVAPLFAPTSTGTTYGVAGLLEF